MLSASTVSVSGGKPRRWLAPSEKYEMWMSIVTGQATQREAAERCGVDRLTVVTVCRVVKRGALDALAASVPGRPGQSGPDAALAVAWAEVERGACHGRASKRWRCIHTRDKRVGIDHWPGPATGGGDNQGRPAGSDRPRGRAGPLGAAGGVSCSGSATSGAPAGRPAGPMGSWLTGPSGGHPLHGLLESERAAIVALFPGMGRD